MKVRYYVINEYGNFEVHTSGGGGAEGGGSVQKFLVVVAVKHNECRAVVCADYAVEWACADLRKQGYAILRTPVATCHWSAQVVPSREGGDWDTRWEES